MLVGVGAGFGVADTDQLKVVLADLLEGPSEGGRASRIFFAGALGLHGAGEFVDRELVVPLRNTTVPDAVDVDVVVGDRRVDDLTRLGVFGENGGVTDAPL